MKNKILIALIIVLSLISISAVCADENVTDGDVLQDTGSEMVIDEVDSDANPSGDEIDDSIEENPDVIQNSTISASDVVGYEKFSTKIVINLTADNQSLAGKSIRVTVNDVSYKRATDSNGQATLNVRLTKGSYDVMFSYAGDENTTPCNGSSKITVKNPLKTTIKVADKDINYRQGLKNAFIVRLLDENGKAVKNQEVTFKVNGKTYTAKTDNKGYAEVFLSLKKGTYKVKYSFAKNAPYLSSSGSYKIKVKAPLSKGNGYWVWSSHMYSVNLKKLSKLGTKHIFLHVHAISVYGKSAVSAFAKKAHKYGIKVHLWMQICYNGGKWVRPMNKDGTIKYSFLNKKIAEAKRYSKIKYIDGVHFDYIRFGGTAHLYKNPEKAINYFIKKASVGIHKSKPNCIVSAAVMPEPSKMMYWYAQEIPTMGKYLDVLVPMVYKGNFNKKTPWITSIVSKYKKQSKSAVIWAGLQTYKSDNNAKKLTHAQLLKDAKAAKAGGATGSILFRIGITHYLNFKKV
ncbi:hypothetical protein [Methanobrevibacter sp.]|uniref:hypothetical protein n=1 Tax=Methanobrevibacter sp. TaxID=66852 RepID=UPI003868AFFB